MQRTEKNHSGKLIVIALVALSALGTGLTWLRYDREHPATKDARFLGDRRVAAVFAKRDLAAIRPGMKAIVSFGPERLPALVAARPAAGAPAGALLLVLSEVPRGIPGGAACQVTVDTTLPPHEPPLD